MLLMFEQAPWIGWTLLVLVVGLVVAGFVFSFWMGIAALGLDAFLVVMAMSFVVMAYGFNSITGANLSSHTLSVEGDRLRLEFDDGKSRELPRSEAQPYRIYPGGVVVPLGGKNGGWLWIPPSAFDTPGEFHTFLKAIYKQHESNTEQEP